jgi:hypothetical protein
MKEAAMKRVSLLAAMGPAAIVIAGAMVVGIGVASLASGQRILFSVSLALVIAGAALMVIGLTLAGFAERGQQSRTGNVTLLHRDDMRPR